jgi:hypothetical protein
MKYKYHDENSPRGFVHLVFDLYGENAARALGGHLPLEPVTVEQYVREFKTLAISRATPIDDGGADHTQHNQVSTTGQPTGRPIVFIEPRHCTAASPSKESKVLYVAG